jgi:DNA-binding NarL/FixJ family response regulator
MVLAGEAAARGCSVEVFDSLVGAVQSGPRLVFANWPVDRSAGDMLEGLRTAKVQQPPVRVVALLARGLPDYKRRAVGAGAEGVLFTPLDRSEVAAEIAASLDEMPAVPVASAAGDRILTGRLPAEIRRSVVAESESRHHVLLIPEGATYGEARTAAMEMIDGIYLERLLRENAGNQSAAAEAAGIDRKTLLTRLENSKKWNR